LVLFAALLTLVGAGCATSGRAGDGIVMIGENGQDRRVTPEEIDGLSGIDRPYFIQVGDVVDVGFHIRAVRADEPTWNYKIEVGDSMEVRFSPPQLEPGEYRLEEGDVIGISFLDNWQLNVTRTVRTDGMITAPEVGDVLAKGRTSMELRDALRDQYAASGIVEGTPRVTVNVDFVNTDRYENMSRDVIVRPDGAISLPNVGADIRIAGLTVAEAADKLSAAAESYLANRPRVALIIFPAVDTSVLAGMGGAVQVRPDGHISLARLGDVPAAGYSLDELRHRLQERCAGLINNSVEVSTDLLKATGGRIYVGGEVGQPGVYPLEGAPTALQAVLMASGSTNTARMNNVIVLRRNPEGKPYVFNTNLHVALTRGHTENDIRLMPFDTVFVPKSTIAKLNLFVEQYIENMVPFDNSMGINAQYYMNEQKIDSKGRSINFNTGVTGITDILNP
jgi:protein involved in polysaccharide export with SLBB domain